jgi:guanylate kinase
MENNINNDQELYSYFVQRNDKLCEYNFKYLMEHKEIKLMISDYLSNILLHKPDDVFKFTKDYFRILHDEPDTNKALIVVGPHAVGKSLFIEKLMKDFPGCFKIPKKHTSREIEIYDESDYIHVEKDEFIQMINSLELIDYKYTNGEYEGITVSEIERLNKQGKVSKNKVFRYPL